jgi:hypothetical protein
MTKNELIALFKKYDSEFLEYENIEGLDSGYKDLYAMNILAKLIPNGYNMVSASEHDVIWLEPGLEELAEVITEEQVLELIQCGVMMDDDEEGLQMFT